MRRPSVKKKIKKNRLWTQEWSPMRQSKTIKAHIVFVLSQTNKICTLFSAHESATGHIGKTAIHIHYEK
jgi:hypothetical protein